MLRNQLRLRAAKPAIFLGIAAAAIGTGLYFKNLPLNSFSSIADAYAAEAIAIPAPKNAITEPEGIQTAVFAGGCFWGIEAVYERVSGVISAEPGYAGGTAKQADYDLVSNGYTSHAEAVQIRYDPAKISYNELLHIFFSVAHNPTERDRQGPDIGKQYRSAIFATNDAQRNAVRSYIEELNAAKLWNKPIATKLETGDFYTAEPNHQNYLRNNPDSRYIQRYDMPKLDALKRMFPKRYSEDWAA